MKVRPAVLQMKPYSPPLEERVDQDYLLLDFSESTQPPPEVVREAMRSYLDSAQLQTYPAYGPFQEELSAYASVDPNQVIITNGSDSAIQLITRALLDPEDEMVFAKPGFVIIEHSALACGARVVSPQYRPPDYAFPLEDILGAVSGRTRLIALVNPNNPTGTLASVAQIEAVLAAHPSVAVMVDEAYYEFSGVTAIPLLERYENLVITRTFSKAFALAGLRLGYALSNPAFIAELHKVRIPYDVNTVAVVAARAQLQHPAGWRNYVDEVMNRAKPMMERFFDEHGVTYTPSGGNFMLVHPDNVQAAVSHLEERRILVRPQRPPLQGAFRLSIGTVADMQRFMEVYAQYPGLQAHLRR